MRKRILNVFLLAGCLAIIIAISTPTTSYAASLRASNLKSKNVFQGTGFTTDEDGTAVLANVCFDARDLITIANEIDELELEYKSGVIKRCAKYGVYFQENGNPTLDADLQSDLANPTFDQLNIGIKMVYAEGQITKVNGGHLRYVYHVHIDKDGNIIDTECLYQTENPGGCYKSGGHEHDAVTITICPYHEENGRKVYDCDNATNKWIVNCGKTEETIENIIIDYDINYVYDEMLTGHRSK